MKDFINKERKPFALVEQHGLLLFIAALIPTLWIDSLSRVIPYEIAEQFEQVGLFVLMALFMVMGYVVIGFIHNAFIVIKDFNEKHGK